MITASIIRRFVIESQILFAKCTIDIFSHQRWTARQVPSIQFQFDLSHHPSQKRHRQIHDEHAGLSWGWCDRTYWRWERQWELQQLESVEAQSGDLESESQHLANPK